jgi:hypothetical protein
MGEPVRRCSICMRPEHEAKLIDYPTPTKIIILCDVPQVSGAISCHKRTVQLDS